MQRLFDVFCKVSYYSSSSSIGGEKEEEDGRTATTSSDPLLLLDLLDGKEGDDEGPFIPEQDHLIGRRMRMKGRPSLASPSSPSANHAASDGGVIEYRFPPEYIDDRDVLKSVPAFARPVRSSSSNDSQLQSQPQLQHFTFVLTDSSSGWTFGFVRSTRDHALVVLSPLPFTDAFFRILNHVHDLVTASGSDRVRDSFLRALYDTPVSSLFSNHHHSTSSPPLLSVAYCGHQQEETFSVKVHNSYACLPSVPEDRNLTELLAAVDPVSVMVPAFAALLHERRLLVTSSRLCRLTSCVLALNQLLFPLCWQHILIPVLPHHLTDYLTAPMPFLIGLPCGQSMAVDDLLLDQQVVHLDADRNLFRSPFPDDLHSLPLSVVAFLTKSLAAGAGGHGNRQQQNKRSKNKNKNSSLLGERISRSFLQAVVMLIGGYRDAFSFPTSTQELERDASSNNTAAAGKSEAEIRFDATRFVASRPPAMQPFLQQLLQTQLLQQFIQSRIRSLDQGLGLNDEFERQVSLYEQTTRRRTTGASSAHALIKYGDDFVVKCKRTSKELLQGHAGPSAAVAADAVMKQVKWMGSRSSAQVRAVRRKITGRSHAALRPPARSRREAAGPSANHGSRQHHDDGDGGSHDDEDVMKQPATDDDSKKSRGVERVQGIEWTDRTATYVRLPPPAAADQRTSVRRTSHAPALVTHNSSALIPDLMTLSLDELLPTTALTPPPPASSSCTARHDTRSSLDQSVAFGDRGREGGGWSGACCGEDRKQELWMMDDQFDPLAPATNDEIRTAAGTSHLETPRPLPAQPCLPPPPAATHHPHPHRHPLHCRHRQASSPSVLPATAAADPVAASACSSYLDPSLMSSKRTCWTNSNPFHEPHQLQEEDDGVTAAACKRQQVQEEAGPSSVVVGARWQVFDE